MLNSASGTMSNSHSYGNDRSGTGATSLEPEYGIDPASGGFFHADSKKYPYEFRFTAFPKLVLFQTRRPKGNARF